MTAPALKPQAEAAPQSGARLLVSTLERLGVEVVFGYPGGAIMPVYDALAGSKLKHVLVRHEQGAAAEASPEQLGEYAAGRERLQAPAGGAVAVAAVPEYLIRADGGDLRLRPGPERNHPR